MNKKRVMVIIVILVLAIIFAVPLKEGLNKVTGDKSKNGQLSDSLDKNTESTYLLEGFPIEKIPLYELKKISSSKIFVNTDPKNTSPFGDKNFAYYNIVFDSNASQENFLNYYKNLFDSEIKEEYDNPEMVKGTIGEYKVTASYYESGNTGYLQVYLPNYSDESLKKYFSQFPDFFKTNSSLVEHEISYGLLSQRNGEVEYTKYFSVIDSGDKNDDGKDDVDEFLALEEEYKNEYKDKPEYSYDEKTGIMKWKNGEFETTLTISRNHGRIYLMLRKGLDK